MFETLYSWDNLLDAYRKAAKGKRRSPPVAAFERRLEDHLLALQIELKEGSYRPGAYRHFFIHEPKRRLISAAPFRDRVVHHALCRLIEPIFERLFIPDSYANRLGKGTHRALDRAQFFSRRNRFVLHLDIQQFFPSVDHSILADLLAGHVHDLRVLRLARLILESGRSVPHDAAAPGYFPGDDPFSIQRPRGLPIGNLTSQFWANVYMNPIDQYIKRTLQCSAYLRYVDDLLLFAHDIDRLWEWKSAIVRRLEGLRLRIHPKAQPHPVSEGFAYLGFVVYPERRRLLRRNAVHYRRKLKRLVRQVERGEAEWTDLQASIGGWINHVRFGNTVGLQKAVLDGLIMDVETINDRITL